MVKAGAVVVDVGINRTEAGLVGDVDPGADDVASAVTPVPGGVGPMTIACLLQNAVRCARYRRGESSLSIGLIVVLTFRALRRSAGL